MKDLIMLDFDELMCAAKEKIVQCCNFISSITVSKKICTTIEVKSPDSPHPLFKKSYKNENEIPAMKLVLLLVICFVALRAVYKLALKIDRYKWVKKQKQKLNDKQD